MAKKCTKQHEAYAKLLFCLSKPIAFSLFSLMSLLLLKLPKLYLMPGGINYTKTTITASYTTVHVVVGIHSQVKPEFPLSIVKKKIRASWTQGKFYGGYNYRPNLRKYSTQKIHVHSQNTMYFIIYSPGKKICFP